MDEKISKSSNNMTVEAIVETEGTCLNIVTVKSTASNNYSIGSKVALCVVAELSTSTSVLTVLYTREETRSKSGYVELSLVELRLAVDECHAGYDIAIVAA